MRAAIGGHESHVRFTDNFKLHVSGQNIKIRAYVILISCTIILLPTGREIVSLLWANAALTNSWDLTEKDAKFVTNHIEIVKETCAANA